MAARFASAASAPARAAPHSAVTTRILAHSFARRCGVSTAFGLAPSEDAAGAAADAALIFFAPLRAPPRRRVCSRRFWFSGS